jgi:hypothetical protein
MAVKLEAIILSEDLIVDQSSKNPSLIGVFNRINAKGFPASHRKICVLADFILSDDAPQVCQIRILNRATNEIVAQGEEITVRPKETGKKIRLLLTMEGVSFSSEGPYDVTLYVDGAVVGTRELTLRKVD